MRIRAGSSDVCSSDLLKGEFADMRRHEFLAWYGAHRVEQTPIADTPRRYLPLDHPFALGCGIHDRCIDHVSLPRGFGSQTGTDAGRSGKASAAADEGHDLEIVAILDSHVDERRARHDLHIAFHGDLGRLEAQLGGELRDRHPRRHPAVLAVDADRNGAVVVHVTPFAHPRRPPYRKRPWRNHRPSMSSMGPTSICSARESPKSTAPTRSEEHTSELQSLIRISYAVF